MGVCICVRVHIYIYHSQPPHLSKLFACPHLDPHCACTHAPTQVWKAIYKKENKWVAIKEFEHFEGSDVQYKKEVSTLTALNESDANGDYVLRMLHSFVRSSTSKSCIVMEVTFQHTVYHTHHTPHTPLHNFTQRDPSSSYSYLIYQRNATWRNTNACY